MNNNPSNLYRSSGDMTSNSGVTSNNDFDNGLRMSIAQAMGDSGFDRDRFDVFGWPEEPSEEDYLALYLRNAYCRVVVDKPAFTSWRDNPTIEDKGGDDTDFEKQVQKLERNHDIWTYGQRVDRVAGIGEHGLLAIGLSDVVGDMDQWAEDARESEFNGLDDINTLKPLLQSQIDDIDWGGPGSERWGKPEYYHIDWSEDIDDESEGEQGPFKVHWTRVIDVPSTRLLDDETLARPRAEPVINNLIDIEKTMGSAAEQSYRGADYGLHINYDPNKVDPKAIENGNTGDEFNKWYHGLQPQFTTVGGEVNTLGGEMQDPSGIVETNLDAISAQTGIPKKELRGNESGQVSGAEEDKKSFFGMISERREQYDTPHIVRSFLDRFRLLGILADPMGGVYDVEWPDLEETSEEDQATIREKRANVVGTAGALIGLTGDAGREFVDSGKIPELDEGSNEWVDEDMPEVPEGFGDTQ